MIWVKAPSSHFPPDLEMEIRDSVEGGVAVGDDGGVVIIPPTRHDGNMLERLHSIELQEDSWFYCLDTLKWDTKRIVCEKAYLRERGLLPDTYQKKLADLDVLIDGK
jgi:4-hydroxy-4-methyl-2-oxoglutarate aldolase